MGAVGKYLRIVCKHAVGQGAVLGGPLGRQFAVAVAAFFGQGLDHGQRPLALGRQRAAAVGLGQHRERRPILVFAGQVARAVAGVGAYVAGAVALGWRRGAPLRGLIRHILAGGQARVGFYFALGARLGRGREREHHAGGTGHHG